MELTEIKNTKDEIRNEKYEDENYKR